MAVMTGRRALVEMLRVEGVEHIFGNPGTTESPIMDELEQHPDLKYVLVLQEGVAIGMADSYARATGRPSFVNLHIETGLANSVSLLHNAFEGGTPLVLSSVNKDVRELAHGRTDLVEMVSQFTKWSGEVTHPEQLPYAMRRAFNEAKTPPTGPTFVGFSANALDEKADVEIVPSPRGHHRIHPDGGAIEEAARILGAAVDPVMVISDRVSQSGASAEAVRVAELLGAKVYSSRFSEVNFPEGHAHYAGAVRLGFPASRELLSQNDAVLMVGQMSSGYYMFSQPVLRFLEPGTKLIHMDSDPRDVGKTQPTDVGIVADPKVALGELAEALEASMSGTETEAAKGRSMTLAEEKKASKTAWQKRLKKRWDLKPMAAERMMSEIAQVLPPKTIIVDDSVTSRDAVHGALEFNEPGSVYGGRGGALGWGMGGAMGIKLAHPDRPVVAVVGDGSAMMTVQGLWTAANEDIPVVYVICNNGSYRVLKINIDAYKTQILKEEKPQSKYLGMDFPMPLDLAGMARAMGVDGRRIEDPAEVGPAMRDALDLGKPALLDVVIDGAV